MKLPAGWRTAIRRASLPLAALFLSAGVALVIGGLASPLIPTFYSAQAREGLIDLRGMPQESSVRLDGSWDFWWRRFVDAREFAAGTAPLPDSRLRMPGLWTGQDYNGAKIGSFGFATFRLRIALPDTARRYGLKFLSMNTAYSAYLDGARIAHAGIPGVDRGSTVAAYTPRTAYFKASRDTVDLVLYVSNFLDYKGGPWMPILFGDAAVIAEARERSVVFEVMLCGGILIVGLYHLMLFGLRRRDTAMLWFSAFCFTIGLRLVLTGERYLEFLLPGIPWEVFLRLEYQTLYWSIAIFCLFIRSLFPDEFPRIAVRAAVGTAAAFSLFSLLSPIPVFSQTVPLYEQVIVVECILILRACIGAAAKDRSGARIILAGSALLTLAAANDILYDNGILQLMLLIPSALLLFILMQAILLALRTARETRRSENLAMSLRKINRALNRFVPKEFMRFLERNSIVEVQPGDQVSMDMAVLFADIRSFTSLSERMTPQENFVFLNDYFSAVCPSVIDNGGFIDKFIGDAIFALFPGSNEDALRAGVAMHRAVEEFNAAGRYPPIAIGVGLHCGPMMLGTIGDARRMETAVISDAVTVAARLEQLTKFYGVRTVVSQSLLASVPSGIVHTRLLDRVRVSGRTEAVGVAELLEGLPGEELAAKLQTRPVFESAVDLFCRRAYEEAIPLFVHILTVDRADKTAQIYLNRCEKYLMVAAEERPAIARL